MTDGASLLTRTALALVPLLAASAGVLQAQDGDEATMGLVIGQVTRGEPAVPVPGAVVYVQGESATAVTDSAGEFRFAMPPGAWTVLAYAPEASPYTTPPGAFVTVEAGMAVRADIDLDAAERGSATNPYTLETLEVIARRREIDDWIRDGARWDILDADFIEARAPSSRHVGDLIRGQFAGLSVGRLRPGGPLCIRSRRAQGTTMAAGGPCGPGQIAVVIDGMKVLDPAYYLPLIPAQDIEEIRYMSGLMAGVRWGTGSENGVLMIRTKTGGG
ncbi:MAG TPA: carboxypeptidase-like regulatory domain-containing protein [Longimicrobiales bacterium]|nr:carboxypeptidase-like regulatory domain-containing protein [Longimicrobiales bacterium]